jgi:hypothetical protein
MKKAGATDAILEIAEVLTNNGVLFSLLLFLE